MLETIRRYGSTIMVFHTKDLNGEIQLRLGSSGSTKNMNTLVYDDIDKTQYKEVCRINGSIYASTDTGYVANGWEVSDMYTQVKDKDSWHEFILMKDGSFLVGDIDKDDININNIQMAYSVDAVVLYNGEDVCNCASHRLQYFDQRHPRTFWGITADGEYVFCTAAGRLTNEAGLLGDEVREVLKEYGCIWGFMNDGGKCSQMLIDGKLVNATVTGGHYPVRNAIFVYFKEGEEVKPETPVVPDDTTTSEELAQLKAELAEIKVSLAEIQAENENLSNIITTIRNLVA